MKRTAVSLLVSLYCSLSHANTLTGITASRDAVQIEMGEAIAFDPRTFSSSSTKAVIDLDDTTTSLGRTVTLNSDHTQTVSVVKSADRVRLVLNFISPTTYTVAVSGSTITVTTAPAKQPEITMVATKTPLDLITEARAIIASGEHLERAVEPLNGILMLPPGEYSEEAQEAIGTIDDRLKLYDRAKNEYKLFLALYPNSPSYTRIKERLIALEIAEPVDAVSIDRRAPRQGKDTKTDASIAEYYITSGSSSNGSELRTDQSTLISNIRAGATFKDDQYTTKLAYRQSRIDNFSNTTASRDMLTLGYVEFIDTFQDYSVRVGRQNAINGAIGRFDGVAASTGFDFSRRVTLLAGVPYLGPTNTNRQFIGGAYDVIWNDHWSSVGYYNFQTADQIAERSAIGAEVRYVRDALSVMSSIEYDTIYSAMNSLTVQATYQPSSYNFYTLYDQRKSPMLYGDRALLLGLNSSSKLPYNSVGEAFSQSRLSRSEVYQFINSSTATSNVFVVGIGKQVNPVWNIAVDYQTSNLSAATDTSFVPTEDNPFSLIAQPATETSSAVNLRVLGTDVLSRGHTVNGILIHSTTGNSSDMYVATLLNGMQFASFRLDLMLMAMQNMQPMTQTSSMTYSLRSNYRLTKSAIEIQLLWTDSEMMSRLGGFKSKSQSVSLVLGWKIDF